jgi:hypothetical protein
MFNSELDFQGELETGQLPESQSLFGGEKSSEQAAL